MAQGNSINDEIKEQKKKFKELSFTEKLQYIWEYYRRCGYRCYSYSRIIYKCIHTKQL